MVIIACVTRGQPVVPRVAAAVDTHPEQPAAAVAPPRGDVPILWRDPGSIAALDFAAGPGGVDGQPRPPFRFVAESALGTTAKVIVVDAHGIKWLVKFGEEVRSQTFANRLAWALGYGALPVYFVATGTVTGVTGLTRASRYVTPDGAFDNASFTRYIDKPVRWLADSRSWTWLANPFVGSHELNGLKVLMMLMSDWDNKDARNVKFGSNVSILAHPDGEARYLVTDWGGSMGTWGGYLGRSKWNCIGFAAQTPDFVKRVQGDRLAWGYVGRPAHRGFHRRHSPRRHPLAPHLSWPDQRCAASRRSPVQRRVTARGRLLRQGIARTDQRAGGRRDAPCSRVTRLVAARSGALNVLNYERPIRTPVAKTSAPPTRTWMAARRAGVSM